MESLDRNHSALWDMAEAIREIQNFTEAVTKEEYLEMLWLKRVVERNFEILGEAARHVSIEFQQAHPEIDWRNSIGVRNIIAHRYKKVDHQILWTIFNTILPILEELAPPLPENEPD
ncbi:MAG: DUF86 domain-containing protein [Cyanobacteria bacterium]|nr:DUF86 domain-containing protein [Cyanobacteriota bacterium]